MVKVDWKAEMRKRDCLVCGGKPTDPCHIKSRGSGGDDSMENLMALCRKCHTEQHTIGIVTFTKRYWKVFEYVNAIGWRIEDGKLRRK